MLCCYDECDSEEMSWQNFDVFTYLLSRPSHIVFNIILDGCRVQNEPGEIEAASGPGPYWRQGNRQEEEEGRPQNRHHRRQEASVQPQEALRCGRFSSGSKLIVFSKASFLLIVLK